MITDEKSGLDECRRIIWEDIYRVRKYHEDSFDYVFDIGAHIGVFSLFTRMRFPEARVVALEPAKGVLNFLHANMKGFRNIAIDKRALGKGGPLYFSPRDHSHSHRFVEEPTDHYAVESVRLTDLFFQHGCRISDSYMLKIDCEGGEKYLMGDEDAESIMEHAGHVAIEVHFGLFDDWLQWTEYDKWIRDRFSRRFSVGYHFSSRKVGCGNYILEPLGRKYRYK